MYVKYCPYKDYPDCPGHQVIDGLSSTCFWLGVPRQKQVEEDKLIEEREDRKA